MHYKMVFIGGGLATLLATYTWIKRGFTEPILILEQSELGGNHTWSFNQTDIMADAFETLKPLISASWNEYSVHFPKLSRTLPITYHSIASTEFVQKILETLSHHPNVHIVTPVYAQILETGNAQKPALVHYGEQNVTADWVIQASGSQSPNTFPGFQKFVGLEFELEHSCSLTAPCIMDVTIPQKDGFRFMYVLPFTENRILVEDTYYSLNAQLNVQAIETEIYAYCAKKQWKIKSVLRSEQGCLPIPIRQTPPQPITHRILPLGMYANLFHSTTGYSLAVNYNFIWEIFDFLSHTELTTYWYQKQLTFYKSMSFYRMLNKFLFMAGTTRKRYRFLEVFYQHQTQETIQRFYAGKTSRKDKLKIFSGRAPFLPSWHLGKALFGNFVEQS